MVSLVGGEVDEAELPLLEPESVLWNLTTGLAEYQRLLGRRPVVYGRRRYGLTPILAADSVSTRLPRRGSFHARRRPIPASRRRQVALGRTRRDGHRRPVARAARRQPAGKPAGPCRKTRPCDGSRSRRHDRVRALAWTRQYVLRRPAAGVGLRSGAGQIRHRWKTISPKPVHPVRIRNSRPTNIERPICSKRPSEASRMRCRDGCATSAVAVRPTRCQTIATLVSLLRQSDATDETLACRNRAKSHCKRPDHRRRRAKLHWTSESPSDCRESVAQLSAALPRDKKPPQRGYLIVNPASYKRRVLVDLPELSTLPGDELPVLAAEEHARQAARDCRVAAGRFCLGGAGRRSADSRMVGRIDRFEPDVAQRALRSADSSGNRRNPIDSRL